MESVIPKIVFNIKSSTKISVASKLLLLNLIFAIFFIFLFFIIIYYYVQISISFFCLNIDSPNSFDPRQRRHKLVRHFLSDMDQNTYTNL